jgi:hypothetical protein
MQKKAFYKVIFFLFFFLYSNASFAWFIIPIPNLRKPPALERLIDTLEQSTETKAIAYVSEDKTFGTKYWLFGHYVGKLSQQETNKIALDKCNDRLQKAKLAEVGGVKTYDYGDKKCELHEFSNQNQNQNNNK